MKQTLTAQEQDAGMRIDKFLHLHLPEYSRSFLQKKLEQEITVNGRRVRANYKVAENDQIVLSFSEPEPLNIVPEPIALDIVYEDDDVIVVNKPKRMVVHPAAGHSSGTLVNALLYHCKDRLSGINGVLRPGIVHRIDQDTSGLLLVCKNDHAHIEISRQLSEHSIQREYRAIVHGRITADSGTISAPIGRHPVDRKRMAVTERNGKPAVTHYQVLKRFRSFTYISCKLETGRTHQIRVHMKSIGHPLLGDEVYGPAKCPYHLQGQTLHAMLLGFVHPTTGEYMEFTAPLPDYFEHLLRILPC
ncbi:MAG: RluA family pseudouridine synthase [Lachnospiraceae bacterium]